MAVAQQCGTTRREGKNIRRLKLTPTNDFPNKEIKEIYHRKEEKSPFLRLGSEVRNRIYELALADKTIHIASYSYPLKGPGDTSGNRGVEFVHAVCQASETERDVYKRSRRCSPNGSDCPWPSLGSYDQRHKSCMEVVSSFQSLSDVLQCKPGPSQEPVKSRLPLALLSVSRQIYKEAALIPYTRSTFAFGQGADFDLFVSTELSPQQRQAIQRVQFGRALDPRSIRLSTVLSLRNLRSVEITVNADKGFLDSQALRCFHGLGLEHARVTINYSTMGEKFSWKYFHKQPCGYDCHNSKRKADGFEALLKDDGRRTYFQQKERQRNKRQKQPKLAVKQAPNPQKKRKDSTQNAAVKRRKVDDESDLKDSQEKSTASTNFREPSISGNIGSGMSM